MPVKNLLYLHSNTAEKHVVCHGVDFKGFLGALEKPPSQLLLIRHDYKSKNYNTRSGFTYVCGDEIAKLKADNISKYGDFCWVDFENEFAPDQLTRLDIAELLYFGHMHRPFSTPIFTRLQNRFAYWSHDDGWYSRIYFTDGGDMQSVIAGAVTTAAKIRHLSKLPEETAKEIVSMSEIGLLVDGGDLSETDDTYILPFYVTGQLTNMDDVIKNTPQYKKDAQKRGTLRFKKKGGEYPLRFWQRQLRKK